MWPIKDVWLYVCTFETDQKDRLSQDFVQAINVCPGEHMAWDIVAMATVCLQGYGEITLQRTEMLGINWSSL